MDITIKRYSEEFKQDWNEFLEKSKNGVFLFNRNYLEYHKHIFKDHSLFILDDGKIIGLLPANEHERTINTHGGLTFGGLILPAQIRLEQVIKAFEVFTAYYQSEGFTEITYKCIPAFYHQVPAQEDLYSLFLLNAELKRRDTGFVIDKLTSFEYQERRKRGIKKAKKAGIILQESNSFDEFWIDVLEPNLSARFGVKPVHSLNEIKYLSEQVPGCIRQFNAYLDGRIIAGTTIFINKTVVHAQYISSTDEGKSTGAIDYLFDELIQNTFNTHRFFSFGIVNEKQGRELNLGLLNWKEGFGAKTYVHDFYKIELNKVKN